MTDNNKSIGFISTEDEAKEKIYKFCEKYYFTYSYFCYIAEINKNILYPFMNGKKTIMLSTLEKIEKFIYDYESKNMQSETL